MKNIYNSYDWNEAIEYLVNLKGSNESKVKMVLAMSKVFKADNKEFNPGKFEEAVWSNETYE